MIEMVAENVLWEGIKDTMYGESHWRRTFLIADAMCKQLPANREVVGMAALLHDIGRVGVKPDSYHGYRGAGQALRVAGNIMATNPLQNAVPKHFYAMMVNIGMITDIVNRHCLESHDDDYLELQVVRDANILDRVRFGGRAMIDVERLSLRHVSEPLIGYAMEILEDTPEERDNAPKLITLPDKKLIL